MSATPQEMLEEVAVTAQQRNAKDRSRRDSEYFNLLSPNVPRLKGESEQFRPRFLGTVILV